MIIYKFTKVMGQIKIKAASNFRSTPGPDLRRCRMFAAVSCCSCISGDRALAVF